MKTIIFSLGGSVIMPDKINIRFLSAFKKIVLSLVNKGKRVVVVCGGGSVNHTYIDAARKISKPSSDDLDWLGIACTKLNAYFLKSLFGSVAHGVVDNLTEKIKTEKRIIIASGWKPGFSSDNDAVLLARHLGSNLVVNITDIGHVYTKDPNRYKGSMPLHSLSWSEYFKIIGTKWVPRMSSPFDPVASKNAQKYGIKVAILKGSKLKNLRNFLNGKSFRGTVIG